MRHQLFIGDSHEDEQDLALHKCEKGLMKGSVAPNVTIKARLFMRTRFPTRELRSPRLAIWSATISSMSSLEVTGSKDEHNTGRCFASAM
jgi:hypothetical protein